MFWALHIFCALEHAGFRPAIDARYRNLPAGVLKPSLKPLHLEVPTLP